MAAAKAAKKEAPTTFTSLAVRLDPEEHMRAREHASRAGISLNKFVNEALVEHNKKYDKAAAKADQQMELVG